VGVMFGFLASGALALWFSIASPEGIGAGMSWLLGSFTRVTMAEAWMGALLVLAALAFALLDSKLMRDLDSLLLGEFDAATLGVDVGRVRRKVLFVTTALVAVSVVLAGSIGFVGLVVPHWARRRFGPLHSGVRGLVARSAGIGALTLVAADVIARSLWFPRELPVGAICSVIGGPIFVRILLGGGVDRARA